MRSTRQATHVVANLLSADSEWYRSNSADVSGAMVLPAERGQALAPAIYATRAMRFALMACWLSATSCFKGCRLVQKRALSR